MNAGVIIVTYNRIELLKECLECVRNQTLPFSNICVVDNHSTDGTEAYLRELSAAASRARAENGSAAPSLNIYRLSANRGGAGGFAYGLRKMVSANCDWLLLIDDDAMLRPDYLEKLAAAVETRGQNHAQYPACSGTVMTGGAIDRHHRRRITNPCLMTSAAVAEEEYQKEQFEYDIGTFCGLMLRTRLVREIGFPKSEYFIWFDDTEYCLRFRKKSPILNVNRAILDHKTKMPADSPALSWKNYYGFRNAIDIGRTYSTRPAVFMAYIRINHLAHIVIDTLGILLGNKRSFRRYRRQIYLDVLRGCGHAPDGADPRYLPGSGPDFTV